MEVTQQQLIQALYRYFKRMYDGEGERFSGTVVNLRILCAALRNLMHEVSDEEKIHVGNLFGHNDFKRIYPELEFYRTLERYFEQLTDKIHTEYKDPERAYYELRSIRIVLEHSSTNRKIDFRHSTGPFGFEIADAVES